MDYRRFLPKTIKCRDYKTYNSESMNRDFSNVDWQLVLNETDVNTSLNLFNKILTKISIDMQKLQKKKLKGVNVPESVMMLKS